LDLPITEWKPVANSIIIFSHLVEIMKLGTQVTDVNPFKPSDAKWLDQYGPEPFGRLIIATKRKTVGMKGLIETRLPFSRRQTTLKWVYLVTLV